MTRREIAVLCCRVLALVVVAWALTYFAQMLVSLNLAIANSTSSGFPENAFWGVKISGSLACALLLFAMALGWKSNVFARWMASDDPAPVAGPELSAEALLPVASTAVGLYAVTRALPTFLRLAAVSVSGQSTLREIWADGEWKVNLISDFLLLAWGVWLIFGTRGLIHIVTWARSAAPRIEPPNGASSLP
jgi:hypothetical protein